MLSVKIFQSTIPVLFITFGLLLKGCGGDQPDQPPPGEMGEEIPQAEPQPGDEPPDSEPFEQEDIGDMDLVETMIIENLSTMVTALESSGMIQEVQDGGPYTVFAPSDEAFQQAPEQVQQQLVNPDPATLEDIMAAHIVEGEYTSDDLGQVDELETMDGGTIQIEGEGDFIEVEGVQIAFENIEAENGVIHTVDAVIADSEPATME